MIRVTQVIHMPIVPGTVFQDDERQTESPRQVEHPIAEEVFDCRTRRFNNFAEGNDNEINGLTSSMTTVYVR
jgi:hypothetical protein